LNSKSEKIGKSSETKPTRSSPDEIRETWFSKVFGMKLVLIIHLFCYLAVNALCYMLNFMIWEGRLWAWHVTAGWGIGIICHLVLYYVFTSGINSISKTILLTHSAVYAVVSVYLFLINIVYMWKLPGVLWAHIPALLWGFGVILNFLTNQMIEGKGLDGKEIAKVIGNMLLLANVCYFGIVNALLFTLGYFTTIYHLAYSTIFGWGLAVGIHAAIVGIINYTDLTEAKKGVAIHAILYAVVFIANIVDITIFSVGEIYIFISYSTRINLFLLGTSLWAIALACHTILAFRWDQTDGDIKDFMKWLLIMHLIAYAVGVMFMIFMNMTFWEGRMWWITAALGWAVGVVVHYLIYIFVQEDEKNVLKISVILHSAAYLTVQGLLLWINLAIWQGRLWVPTVAIGWGIGLLMHLLTYILYNNDFFVPEKGLEVSVLYHGTGYAGVNILLAWLNLSVWEGKLWFPIVSLAWGIGLGAHILIWYFLIKKPQ